MYNTCKNTSITLNPNELEEFDIQYVKNRTGIILILMKKMKQSIINRLHVIK